MKKLLVLIINFIVILSSSISYAANLVDTFQATSSSVIQNMVPNSSQNLVYTLTSPVSPKKSVNVHCAFSSSSPLLTASFNSNGCTSVGGIGINSQLPATINVTVTAAAGATGSMTGLITFTQTFPQSRSPAKIFSVPITIQSSNRTITFFNGCSSDVWFGVSSSSTPAKNIGNIPCTKNSDCSAYTFSLCVNNACGGGACNADTDCTNTHAGTCTVPTGSKPGTHAQCTYCASNSDCLTGAKCNTTNHQCYWALPTPNSAGSGADLTNYDLGTLQSNTITMTDNSNVNGYSLLWSGTFAGRTTCTGGNPLTCATAGCNVNGAGADPGGCATGEGFLAPSSIAEVTFVSTTPDTYDVSIINGTNIPISIFPTSGSAASPQAYNNPYSCGKPGSGEATVTSAGTIGGCSWNFTPPAAAYRWVSTTPGGNCTTDSDCTSSKCGLTSNAITGNSSQTTCGAALGYWNQNEICATNSSYSQASIIDCTQTNIGGTGNSIINLLACTGDAATSCFNVNSASATCCGCTNWQNEGVNVPTNPSIVAPCNFPNTTWGYNIGTTPYGSVLPGLVWLKDACPSAYVYSFDDKTSTFTCPLNNGQSGVNYTVVFCPAEPVMQHKIVS